MYYNVFNKGDNTMSKLKALQSKIAEASRLEVQIEAIDKQIEALSHDQDDLVESRKQLEREIEELTGEAFEWANKYNNGVVEVDGE